MSFYWRWVVVRTAVAAIAGTVDTLATLAISRTYGPDELLWISMSISALTFLPIILAEHHVLASRFPALSRPLYVTMTFLPVLVFLASVAALGEVAGLAMADSPATSAESERGDVDPGLLLAGLGLGLLSFISLLGVILLPWVAIAQVAQGFLIWMIAIVLAVTCYLGFDYAVVSLRGLEWPEPSPVTWIGATWTYIILVCSELVYALISGIGVARLRPIPEGTSRPSTAAGSSPRSARRWRPTSSRCRSTGTRHRSAWATASRIGRRSALSSSS